MNSCNQSFMRIKELMEGESERGSKKNEDVRQTNDNLNKNSSQTQTVLIMRVNRLSLTPCISIEHKKKTRFLFILYCRTCTRRVCKGVKFLSLSSRGAYRTTAPGKEFPLKRVEHEWTAAFSGEVKGEANERREKE